jgi:hypothetical protein
VASVAPCTAKPNDEFVDCGAPQKSRPTRLHTKLKHRSQIDSLLRLEYEGEKLQQGSGRSYSGDQAL